MKKIKILILFMCISLISYAQTSFDGKWNFSDMTTPAVSFSLMITQNGSTITGWHCSVMFDGNFIDCALDETSITGTVSGDMATVTFFSDYANDSGVATITKIDDTHIKWKIITQPDGVYYIPDEVILTKVTGEETDPEDGIILEPKQPVR